MEISNVNVYGLEESILASGYPMLLKTPNAKEFDKQTMKIALLDDENKHIIRAEALAKAPIGSGHNNFLTGIIVQFDLEMPQYFWAEWQRYHFQQIVSSTSKMHKLLKADIAKMCVEGTDERVIAIAGEYGDRYNKGECDFDTVLANVPMGYQLTARISTNYQQIKTMVSQRKNHRLKAWNKVFMDFVKKLPMAEEFLL